MSIMYSEKKFCIKMLCAFFGLIESSVTTKKSVNVIPWFGFSTTVMIHFLCAEYT